MAWTNVVLVVLILLTKNYADNEFVKIMYKNLLDLFSGHGVHWQDQEIIYDFRAQLQGTGSRSDVFIYD